MVLAANRTVSLALPCRASVCEDGGKTKIGTLLRAALLGVFPGSEVLGQVAGEVEGTTLKLIDEAQ